MQSTQSYRISTSGIQSEGKILDHLLNMPYVNRVSLGEQNLSSKPQNITRLLNRQVLDLSKEILWPDVCGSKGCKEGFRIFKH